MPRSPPVEEGKERFARGQVAGLRSRTVRFTKATCGVGQVNTSLYLGLDKSDLIEGSFSGRNLPFLSVVV